MSFDQHVIFTVVKASWTDFGGFGSTENGSWGHLGAALGALGAVLEMSGAAS